MDAVTDILALIDAAVQSRCRHCRHCRTALDDNGPSEDFCGPDCQHAWADLLVVNPWAVYGRGDPTPAELGETPPPRAATGIYHDYRGTDRSRNTGASATLVTFDEADLLPVPVVDESAAAFTAVQAGWHQFAVTFADRFVPAIRRMSDAWTAFRPIAEQSLADQPPTDPMQRALWLRRHRNTGPATPVRTPWRIDPRRHR